MKELAIMSRWRSRGVNDDYKINDQKGIGGEDERGLVG